jgi:HAD superfamily hydrolase (TIGR01549 family)
MPVLLDLDNTLVDRDAAFSRWADDAISSWGGDVSDATWLVEADAHGYTPRAQLAAMIIERYDLPAAQIDDLVTRLLYEHVDYIECYPGVLVQLAELAHIGEPLVIVTNGDSRQQRMKLERTGLTRIVTGSAISAELGFKKPDPRIFSAALEIAESDGFAWMVGDHIEADIVGGRAAGLATAWVTHGRTWTERWEPTLMERSTAEALASISTLIRDAR